MQIIHVIWEIHPIQVLYQWSEQLMFMDSLSPVDLQTAFKLFSGQVWYVWGHAYPFSFARKEGLVVSSLGCIVVFPVPLSLYITMLQYGENRLIQSTGIKDIPSIHLSAWSMTCYYSYLYQRCIDLTIKRAGCQASHKSIIHFNKSEALDQVGYQTNMYRASKYWAGLVIYIEIVIAL